MAVGSLECSRPSAWPSSCTATKNKSLPSNREKDKGRMFEINSGWIEIELSHFNHSHISCKCT